MGMDPVKTRAYRYVQVFDPYPPLHPPLIPISLPLGLEKKIWGTAPWSVDRERRVGELSSSDYNLPNNTKST